MFVRLRDLSEQQDRRCVKWFERAFGAKRNIMKVVFRYTPKGVDFMNPSRQNARVILRFTYEMFNELKNEFDLN